jgi:hypothetical protein
MFPQRVLNTRETFDERFLNRLHQVMTESYIHRVKLKADEFADSLINEIKVKGLSSKEEILRLIDTRLEEVGQPAGQENK